MNGLDKIEEEPIVAFYSAEARYDRQGDNSEFYAPLRARLKSEQPHLYAFMISQLSLFPENSIERYNAESAFLGLWNIIERHLADKEMKADYEAPAYYAERPIQSIAQELIIDITSSKGLMGKETPYGVDFFSFNPDSFNFGSRNNL